MKRLLTAFVLTVLGFSGAYTASAQYHNLGVQMDMVWPKGGGITKSFNSLYGGFFYEYRFRGSDVDIKEFKDHFGIEAGINYTEFLFRQDRYNITSLGPNVFPGLGKTPSAKSTNKGVNLYVAPKFYFTIYPDLVEGYVMARAGGQYLNTTGSLSYNPNSGSNLPGVTNAVSAEGLNSINFFAGAAFGAEVKLGTVFLGVNFGFDTNSITRVMKKQEFKDVLSSQSIKAFSDIENNWGNLILEFKVKALLNGD